MKILCLVDKIGRIQHTRLRILAKYFKQYQLDIHVVDDHVDPNRYDAVYYSHFSLFKKKPTKKKKIASVTSHKCLNNFKNTIKELKQFDAISVNNTLLFDIFENKVPNLYYTPNGVDANIFVPQDNKDNTSYHDLVFGWVGNKDRATKNYLTILKPLQELSKECLFKKVLSSKGDSVKKLLNQKQMVHYYNQLDFLLVTSDTEGTPNPALEALACGVPIITTRVGNMIDIIVDKYNGFFVDNNLKSFARIIEKAKKINIDELNNLKINARQSIESWDWGYQYVRWYNFFNTVKNNR